MELFSKRILFFGLHAAKRNYSDCFLHNSVSVAHLSHICEGFIPALRTDTTRAHSQMAGNVIKNHKIYFSF